MSGKRSLNIVVEDVISEALMRRLLDRVGCSGKAPTFRIAGGNRMIRKNLDKYKGASRVVPHIVLTDLDRYPCPPALMDDWGVGTLPETMLLRIAVREAESWLLADREGIAGFLHAAKEKVPFAPETLDDPKKALFGVIRKSRRRRLVQEMIPQAGAHIGPLYNDRMLDFTIHYWNIERAIPNAPSLDRCISRIADFLQRAVPYS